MKHLQSSQSAAQNEGDNLTRPGPLRPTVGLQADQPDFASRRRLSSLHYRPLA